jgi:hypothetical protein
MSKYIRVSDPEIADDLLLKSQKIIIEGKKFQTPIKTIDASKLRSDIQVAEEVKGLNETYKTFNEKRLGEYITGEKDESKINKELDRYKEKTNSKKEATICFVSYEEKKFPNERGIDFLMDIAHEFSDATPLPLLPLLFRDDKRDFPIKINEYRDFMKKCIESINKLNNKPILGVIPEITPSTYISDLIAFYYDNDITSFVYDFNGKVPSGMKTKLRRMMIALKDVDLLEKSFLYSANANNGKMIKNAPIIRARDILTFGYGFNALGDQHIRRRFPPDIAKMLKERMRKEKPMIRLFNDRDYGYYKTSDVSILEKMYPTEKTLIPFENFKIYNTKTKCSQVLFNNERLGEEAIKYREMIKEVPEKTTNYFETKEYVREKDIKDLVKFRSQISL